MKTPYARHSIVARSVVVEVAPLLAFGMFAFHRPIANNRVSPPSERIMPEKLTIASTQCIARRRKFAASS